MWELMAEADWAEATPQLRPQEESEDRGSWWNME